MRPRLHLVLPDDHDIGRHIHTASTGRREHEAFPRSRAATQRDFARVAVAAVLDEVGEQGMRDEASVDVDQVVTAVGAEAGPPVADAHANCRAVPGLGQCLPEGDVGAREAPDATKRVEHDLALQLDLHRGVDVLPSASTAPRRDVRAGRRDAAWGGLVHRHDGRLRIVHVLVVDLCVDELAGKGTIHEHDPAIVVACRARPRRLPWSSVEGGASVERRAAP